MKYDIRKTSQFKKDFDTVVKRGLDINEFRTVLELLVNGSTIPERYRDHPYPEKIQMYGRTFPN